MSLRLFALLGLLSVATTSQAAVPTAEFVRTYCIDCHTGKDAEAGFDLTTLKRDFSDGETLRHWIKIYDHVIGGEMPPSDAKQPPAAERTAWTKQLQQELIDFENARRTEDGRTPVRRMTRVEYENTIRDLFALDGISLQSGLPEDGSAHGFDNNADALDISHVNLAKYVEAADHALNLAIAVQPQPPQRQTHRMSLARHVYLILMNGDAVMLRDGKPDPEFSPGGVHAHVGVHEHILVARGSLARNSSVGVFRHEDESFKPYFYDFAALYPGRYQIRTSFWSFGWDKGKVLPGRGVEAARLSVVQLQDNGRGGGHPSYILGYYDAPPDKPQVHTIDTWLNFKDTIGFNTASLAPTVNYSRPGRAMAAKNPGIACDWFEIEGPFHDVWPPESHRRLFGDLPLTAFDVNKQSEVRPPKRKLVKRETQAPNPPDPPAGNWTVASVFPQADADRLLASFLPRAFRRPVPEEIRKQYLAIFNERLTAGDCFETALRYTYRAALCSPDFLYHVEHADAYDDHALASRLSYFLWNSLPDETLLAAADAGKLRTPKVLREETERLLNDPKAQRFIDDFLGQWLNLRKIAANDPDRKLYPEFSSYLQDSMLAESRAYFRELLEKDLNVGHLVRSDFAMLNEKLATLYGVPNVSGSQIRRVPLPKECPRGPFLTQAAVLKVTANGTTTSPVPRGAFVMARFLGEPPEPPPPSVPAVEPDVQGATTIREQLDNHRSLTVCAGCHAKIDPPGFALESFDVIGGLRDRYRSIGMGDNAPRGSIDPLIGISFKLGKPVDSSGQLPDGRKFGGIQEFQTLLAGDSQTLLTNLAEQLCVYATGRPIGFSDRAEIASIVDHTQKKGGGIRTLLHEVVQSKLFLPVGPTNTKPAGPTIVAAMTPTRATPPNLAAPAAPSQVTALLIGGVSVAPKPAEVESTTAAAQPAQSKFRLVGLNNDERLDELTGYLQAAPELQLVNLDKVQHEITLAYDLARLFPSQPKNRPVTEEMVLQQINGIMQKATQNSFTLRPVMPAEARTKLRREEVAVLIEDCKACRLGVYMAAMKLDGVEQAAVDRKTGRLIVWLDPAKTDSKRVRDGLATAKIELPTP